MDLRQRWVGLDIAKALCVLVMVFIHSSFWLITSQDEVMNTQSFMYPIVTHTTFLGLFPLSLPATAGCGLRLYLDRLQAQGRELEILPLVRTSAAIMVLGYLMTLLTWGPSQGFEWDVLHFVGLSYLVISIALKLTTIPVMIIMGLMSMFATDIFRDLWSTSNSFLAGILIGNDSGFFFWPFFPWFATLIFGFALTHFFLETKNSRVFQGICLAIGVALIAFSLWLGDFFLTLNPENVWGENVFRPRLGFILGLMGFFSTLVTLGQWIGERVRWSNSDFIQSFSRGILWIYLIHIIVGARLASYYTKWVPLNVFTALLFSFSLIAFSYLVGKGSIILTEKQLRITLVKAP
ncbi:MAG: DUF1624 domain-containing protein [Bdellovibrionales bacterium]|nr:DUF1624 domain-containing protein [Bdellovibrionales bacterium]